MSEVVIVYVPWSWCMVSLTGGLCVSTVLTVEKNISSAADGLTDFRPIATREKSL